MGIKELLMSDKRKKDAQKRKAILKEERDKKAGERKKAKDKSELSEKNKKSKYKYANLNEGKASSKYLIIRLNNNGWESKRVGKKTYRSFSSQLAHDFRLEKMDEGYLKYPERSNENLYYIHPRFKNIKSFDGEEALETAKGICDVVEQKYKDNNVYGRGLRSDTKPIITGVIGFSSGFDPKEKTEELHKALSLFIQQEFGMIMFGSSHKDETSYHFHYITTQVHQKTGELNKHIDTSQLQDKLQFFLEERGLSFNHKRGVKKEETNAEHFSIMQAKNKELEKQTIEAEFLKMENESLRKVNDELIKANKVLSKDMLEYFKEFTREISEWVELAKTDGMDDDARFKQMEKLTKRVGNYLANGHFEKAGKTIEKIEYHMGKIQKKINNHSLESEELESQKKIKEMELSNLHKERAESIRKQNLNKKSFEEINKMAKNNNSPKPKPTF